MPRFLIWTGLLSALVGVSACGGAVKEPETPGSGVPEPQTQVTPQHSDAPPTLIAPPPAYGNKIVLAASEAAATHR